MINAGIDLAYISSGLLLLNRSTEDPMKKSQFSGFGNSMILQGGFLLLFDWIAFSIHRKHSKKSLSPLLQKIELTTNGIGLKWNIGNYKNKHLKRSKAI